MVSGTYTVSVHGNSLMLSETRADSGLKIPRLEIRVPVRSLYLRVAHYLVDH